MPEVGAMLVPIIAIDAPHAPHPRMRYPFPFPGPDHRVHGLFRSGKDRDFSLLVLVEKAGDDLHLRARQVFADAGTGEAIEDRRPHDPPLGSSTVWPAALFQRASRYSSR